MMIELLIMDSATLRRAAAYLHDAVFESENIRYAKDTNTITIPLWREMYEHTTSKRVFLFLYRWRAPHRRCILVLKNVESCTVRVTDALDHYQVTGINFNESAHELKIETACCIDILLKANRLEGSLCDLEEETTEHFSKTTLSFSAFKVKRVDQLER